MAGGITLSLKKSENKILQVPIGIPVPKKPAVKQTATSSQNLNRVNVKGGRTITIPRKLPLPTPQTIKIK